MPEDVEFCNYHCLGGGRDVVPVRGNQMLKVNFVTLLCQ